MNLLEYIKSITKYKKVIDYIQKQDEENILLANASNNIAKILTSITFLENMQNIIYITSDLFEASKAFETISELVGADFVSFFPVEDFYFTEEISSSPGFKLARMLTLYNVIQNNPKIIVTNSDGALKNVLSNSKMKEAFLNIRKKQIISRDKVIEELINRGYKKVTITEELGTFSVRGSIIDIYPINENYPIRLNFFDDEVENIKKINVVNQMSMGQLDEVLIFPLDDIYYDNDNIPNIINKLKTKHKNDEKINIVIEKIKNYDNLESLYIYLPCIEEDNINFLEFVKPYKTFYDNFNVINEYQKNKEMKLPEGFQRSLNEILEYSKQNIFISKFKSSLNDIPLDKIFDLMTINNFEYNNNLKTLIEDIRYNEEKTYIITHQSELKMMHIKEMLDVSHIEYNYAKEFEHIKPKKINLVICENAIGFIDNEIYIEILSPNEYSPSKITRNNKYSKYYKESVKIYNKDELQTGDYVVHRDYGIGKYVGIKTVELHNTKNDYLCVEYANDGKLYIPVENIYVLEKYIGSKDTAPKLNNISGKEWQKKKAKVKAKILEIAQKLIKVQAERETRKGYIYNEDTIDQYAFEKDFNFNETSDQLKAIEDVKKDMEGPHPVDRLVCGDVGFGKTEVAMRAAFKAVDNGKQVAYLAPTTVLTRQHFYTFKERFEKYGVKVELLNRFVPIKEQKNIIEGIKTGYVDIVIGTHRLLSKDIKFKDLGMLIVDEEQRFGVEHKERIKMMKSLVDVLTLSATPIPRTLQLTLSGLRDLSLIETPPTNRMPVQTYVLENNDIIVKEAINRELSRGGQVFYLLNRISELDRIVNKVQKLVPHAKIGMIHGRMDKDSIELELTNFLEKKYNVLVCTTIIETGIDIPNANTMIIERADILGLSQLYQIRGRVGRSDRISYAYLMYDKSKVLTEDAMKRLDAIKEFTELGSGYKIAMRDLAIRGAGDILGSEQSGFIDDIGLDLYMKMLKEAIDEIKNETHEEVEEKRYNISISKHISDKYVSDDPIRIEIHQSINKIRSREQINLLVNEYTDRYGVLSEEIILYMESKYLEYLLKVNDVEYFKEEDDKITIIFSSEKTKRMNFKSIYELSIELNTKFKFDYDPRRNKVTLTINPKLYQRSYIYVLTQFLEKIV